MNCPGVQETRGVALGHVEVTLSPDSPHATCDFVNTFVPVATVSLAKTIGGDGSLRTGAVTIGLHCDDGTTATLHAAPGSNGPFQLAQPIVFREFPVSCTATETSSGVQPPASVTTTNVVITDGSSGPESAGTSAHVAVAAGQTIVVRFTNTYRAAPPSPSGTSQPASPPASPTSSAGAGGTLAHTGADVGTLLGIALALILGGAGVVYLGKRRGRRA